MTDHLDFVLAQWERERPDLDVSAMGVIGRLSRLSRLFGVELEKTFGAYGLDRGAFDMLATLRRSGPPFALTPAGLMRASMVTSGAITQRLDRLESRGWVSRTPSASDGRGVVVALTDEGLALIDTVLPAHVANEERMLASLSTEQREQLSTILRQLLVGLGDVPS